MDVRILNQNSQIMLHQHMQTSPETRLTAIAPDHDDTVVADAWISTWSGLADLCAQETLPFVLGHARSMQANRGGHSQQ